MTTSLQARKRQEEWEAEARESGLSDEELEVAQKMGLWPKQYAECKRPGPVSEAEFREGQQAASRELLARAIDPRVRALAETFALPEAEPAWWNSATQETALFERAKEAGCAEELVRAYQENEARVRRGQPPDVPIPEAMRREEVR